MAKDYYGILGVSRTASADEIKRAYRKLAHQHHPDKSGGDEAKFKQVNEAYQVLSNEEKRRQYDQFGQTFEQTGGAGFDPRAWQDFANQGFGGWRANVDVGDIGDIFEDFFGFGAGQRTRRRTRGADIQMDVTIAFPAAAFGTTETIELYKDEICPRCHGNQAEPGTKLETCPSCQGSGVEQTVQRTILGAMRSTRVCATCHGQRTVPTKPCRQCNGQGFTKQAKKVEIKIPGGIEDGQTIRLSGQGEIGQPGAQPGDLYVTVHIRPDKRFARDGADIHSTVPLTFSEAALGTTKVIATLDGEVELKIPAGTQSGRVFKLSGKGLQRLEGNGRGDQLVTVEVKTPTKPSRRLKNILEQLAGERE